MWPWSVVRMKKSFEALILAAISLKRGARRSPSSRGVVPSASACRVTGSPCSSVPVRKKTSSPRWRWWRAGVGAGVAGGGGAHWGGAGGVLEGGGAVDSHDDGTA